ncbi:hypothetical protein BGZ76_011384 [Entomortierella beljakovae]|nr:hypothetical protein BGZ76_011384 [Entomortierella beljakovae]
MSMSQAYSSTISPIDKHSLEQDDIKAQFNSIVSPYGILFPEHHFQDSNTEESSPFALTFTLNQSNEPRRDLSTTFSRSTNQGIDLDMSTTLRRGRDMEGVPSEGSYYDDNVRQNEKEVKAFMEGYDRSDWNSSNRDSKPNKDSRGSKSGSKIVKGWKKLRESLRQSPLAGPEPKRSHESRSSIMEESRSEQNSTSSVEIRKAVSDMDSPLGLDIEEETEQVKGIRSRFRSGSLKSILHKGSSASSLCDLDSRDSYSMKGVNKDSKSNLQGGTIVVDVETIMSLGRMRQYNKEDLLNQQKQSSLPEPINTESGYGSSVSSMDSGKGDRQVQLAPQESLVRQHSPDCIQELQLQSPDLIPSDSTITKTTDYEGSINNPCIEAVPSTKTEDSDSVVEEVDQTNRSPVSTRLLSAQNHTNSQRWRLSTEGMPRVLGTICESKHNDTEANEHYLHQLMRNSTIDEEISEDTGTSEEPDRRDRTFEVPLLQTIQLASATFENGERIPLSVYYVTEELSTRGDNDSLEISELFPENWDKMIGSFDNLVQTFDSRPFGQGFDLSTKTQAILSDVRSPIEPEKDIVADDDTEAKSEFNQQENDDDGSDSVVNGVDASAPVEYTISSRDLSCIILRFLNDLPEPLLSQDVFTTFSSIIHLQTIDSIKTQASSLLIQMLSREQRHLLKFLLEFLDDVIFKKMRDDISHFEQSMTESLVELPTQDTQSDLDRMKSEFTEQTKRITRIVGAACTQATTFEMVVDSSLVKNSSQNSLYRHYKKEFETKALQERKYRAIQESQAVLQFLMNFRVSVFGPSLNSLFSSISMESFHTLSRSGSFQECGGSGHNQYDHARSGVSPRRQSWMRWVHSKPSISRRLRNHLGPRALAKRRFHSNIKGNLSIMNSKRGAYCQNGVAKTPSTGSLCDSAIGISSIDLVAQAAMQEHKARTMRSKKHMPRPSLATLHSVQVEAGSILGTKQERQESSVESENSNLESHNNDTDSITTPSTQHDFEERKMREFEDNAENFVHRLGSPEETLDRKNQEREIQMVEKEILRSEITTKFLASNLNSLYPSSSAAPIPTVILPSARAIIAQTLKTPGLSGSANKDQESIVHHRELTLAPQDEIKLPSDHISSESCTCEYCSTMVMPSKIPVLSKAEYELSELQSQCDGKDQHIAELLKTVQNLQGQVNVLNAKLLFLHDHHTTRPMRRRTLARSSFPSIPVAANAIDYPQKQRHSLQQQRSDSEMSGSQSPPGIDGTNSPNVISLTMAFPEGVQPLHNMIRQYPAGLGGSSGLSSLEEAVGEDDEAMSFLDLDNNHSSSSSIPTHRAQYNRLSRTPSLQTTAASNLGHAVNFDRSSIMSGHDFRYETELGRALREIDEMEEEPEREGEDQLDEHYYLDAYKTMDQQLYRRPILPSTPPPKPMSSEMYKKHHRMSLPIQSMMSKRISLGSSFRWKGKATPA